MAARIAVIGSNMVDLVTFIRRMPNAGETLEAIGFKMGPGGKGANQAVAAARLGSEVLLVSKVGEDLFGQNTIRDLQAAGIDTTHVGVAPGLSSGVAPIFVDERGENRILIVKGANDHLLPADIDRAAEDLRCCGLILLQLEVPLPTVYHAIEFAAKHGLKVLLNPAPAAPDLDLARVRGVDFLVPNQTELALLTGLPTETPAQAEAAARTLLAQGMGCVIVTLAADGALLVTPEGATHIPPVRVQPRDTTGAGDAYIGSFAHHYVRGGDLVGSLTIASAYAALSITQPGTQSSFADAATFEAFRQTLS